MLRKKRKFKINSIAQLSLVSDEIGSEGVKYLSDSLKSNTAITTLDLDNNKIGSDGVKYLSDVLKSNTTITKLACTHLSESLRKEIENNKGMHSFTHSQFSIYIYST